MGVLEPGTQIWPGPIATLMFGVACAVTARSPGVTIPPAGPIRVPSARRIVSASIVVPSMIQGTVSKATGYAFQAGMEDFEPVQITNIGDPEIVGTVVVPSAAYRAG